MSVLTPMLQFHFGRYVYQKTYKNGQVSRRMRHMVTVTLERSSAIKTLNMDALTLGAFISHAWKHVVNIIKFMYILY